MSENPAVRVLQKALLIARRDGPGVLLRKIMARLFPALLNSSVARRLKRAVPPRVTEWLRRRRVNSPSEVVDQELLPPGTPLAGVIIPCYNYGNYLPEAVACALGQTLGNIEIIVVDDGSTDPLTITVLGDIEARGRVRVIRQPNKGLPAARNTGIRATSARYIMCLDADDLIDPTYLEKAVMVLESRPSTGLVYPLAQLFGDVEEIWHTEALDPVKLLQYNHIPVVAVFRREAWEKAGGYDEGMTIGYEDWEFWLRLAGAGYAGHLIPEPLFKHRRHGKTMTHRAQEKHLQLVREIKSKHAGVARAARLPAVEVEPRRAFVNLQAAPPSPGRRRLLALAPGLEAGGAGTVLPQVIKAIEDSGAWEVYLATTLDSPDQWTSLSAITPRLYILPHLFPERFFIDGIASLVQRHGIEAILTSQPEPAHFDIEELKKNFAGIIINTGPIP